MRRFGIEIKVVSLVLLVLLIVATTGIIAYRNFSNIINNVTEASQPDMNLVLLEQLRFNLSDAENNVKSYNLTRDNNYIISFYKSASSIDRLMNEIRHIDTTQNQMLIDSLSVLVAEKYRVLSEIVLLQNNEQVTKELKRISTKLDETLDLENQQDTLLISEEEPEETQSLLKRIFSSKKKKKEIAVFTSDSTLNKIKTVVDSQISVVEREQIKQLQHIKYKELSLLTQDKKIMDEIRSIILNLQQEERRKIAIQAAEASRLADETNRLIAAFCILSSLFLMVVGYVIIVYIRKNKAYNSALKQATAEAEKLASTKEQFLANMSHEIRTPMNAISGFTEQLLQTGLQPEQREQLEIIRNSSSHLLEILNEVLDYSKIQAGKFTFEYNDFEPEQLLGEVAALMSNAARQKNLSLTVSYKNNLPAFLTGDAVRLRQILYNIISNAIKFTHQGGISVEVSSLLQSRMSITLQIKITDTGIGIAKQNLQKIFNAFEQADASVAGLYGGTGLGLSICKKLIELQKGKLSLTSEPGKGTIVTFTIPYRISSGRKKVSMSEQLPAVQADLNGIRILFADDEVYNRKLLEMILSKWNLAITMVDNGRAALAEFESNDYDLLLLDIRMPELNGLELCTVIRNMNNPVKAKVPIVALTAVSASKEIQHYINMGFNACISKPFAEVELLKTIQQLLKLSDYKEPMLHQPKKETDSSSNHFNLAELQNMSKENPAFFEEMVELFIRSTQEGIHELIEAARVKHWTIVADVAHKIMSPCIHVEANKLLELLRSIEAISREHKQVDEAELNRLIKLAEAEVALVIDEMQKVLHKY